LIRMVAVSRVHDACARVVLQVRVVADQDKLSSLGLEQRNQEGPIPLFCSVDHVGLPKGHDCNHVSMLEVASQRLCDQVTPGTRVPKLVLVATREQAVWKVAAHASAHE